MKRSPTSLLRTSIVASLALSAVLLAPARVDAQSPQDLAAARKAFREGEEAEVKGDNETALARFQTALAVKATPQIHLRVGAVEEKLGKLRAALASYQRGFDLAASLPAVAKVAREQIDALTPRIPSLTVTVVRPPSDLVVTLDGAPIAASTFGAALPIDPGPHRIHAEASGRVARDETFTAVERGSARIELDLAPARPIAAPVAPPAESKLPGAIVVSGSGAALVVGAILLGVSVAKDGSIDAQCGGSDRQRCPLSRRDQIEGDVRAVNAMRFSGLGLAALGAAGVAVGTYLLVKTPKSPANTGAMTITPWASTGSAGVVAAGRF